MTSKTYSIANDTANGAVYLDGLRGEIGSSPIPISVKNLPVVGDALTVEFWGTPSAADFLLLDGIVAAHDGVTPASATPITMEEARNPAGLVQFAPAHKIVSESYRKKGEAYSVAMNSTNHFDVEVSEALRLLAGGEFSAVGSITDGDYVEFSIVDKNDVLGLFAALGLTVGVDVLEVKRYVETYYLLIADTGVRMRIEPGTVAEVPNGLFMRATYVSTGLVGAIDLFLWYDYFEG